MSLSPPLDVAQIGARLDDYLNPALSSWRVTDGPARDLAGLDRAQQEFVLHWGEVIARDQDGLAEQFVTSAPQALRLMDQEAVQSWLVYAMDLYDKQGQVPAMRALREVEVFAAQLREQRAGAVLADVAGVLERFVCGLNGRNLNIAPADRPFTDTETLFLPPVLGRLPDKEANFRLYKAMAVHQWAQNWYGTWRAGLLLEALASGRLREEDLDLLHALETARLDACIARDLPGLHRDMLALGAALDAPDPDWVDWPELTRPLADPAAKVSDSLVLLDRLLGRHPSGPSAHPAVHHNARPSTPYSAQYPAQYLSKYQAQLSAQYPGQHPAHSSAQQLTQNPDHHSSEDSSQPPVQDALSASSRRPPSHCYRGELRPEAVRTCLEIRAARERDQFRIALAKLIEEQDGAPPAAESGREETLAETRARLAMERQPDPDQPEGFRFQLLLDGKPLAPPEGVISLMESILQDQGEIPPEYLVAAGPGLYKRGMDQDAELDRGGVDAGTAGVFRYDEWDYKRQHHRKGWCQLREYPIQRLDLDFHRATLAKYGGLVKSIRRTFEVLRGEDCLLRRQPQGEDVDIDALVEAHADHRAGLEMTDRLFIRQSRDDRNIAVCFMVDMSGSTKGWINLAEREALILLAEALETLGDRFAIYGFSGWTRNRCEVFAVKRFDDPYDAAARGRIGGIEAHDYTRMGAPIRHLCKLLAAQEARTRLLITLSDGKPDDYDPQYRGQYGIEDTRQALFEARLAGIHPFCITIDEEGLEYLPHMYGAANFTLVADIARLPAKVADIYRRLTS